MSEASFDADTLIDEIDAGTLSPKSCSVSRAILAQMTNQDEDQRELIAIYDAGGPMNREAWAKKLWRKIEALPLVQQGALRLCVGLLHP